jgi:sortase family protein
VGRRLPAEGAFVLAAPVRSWSRASRWAMGVSGAVLLLAPQVWMRMGPEANVGSAPWAKPVGTSRTGPRQVPVAEAVASAVGVRSLRLADLQPAGSSLPPVELRIPAVGVRAPIVPVGVEPSGAMEIPPDVRTVGWYRFGPSPGDRGSAVLAGHVDSRLQGPGVFLRLHELDPGDVIHVRASKAAWDSFEVVSRNLVAKDRIPRGIFGGRTGPVLTLITCGGEFDQDARSYTHNVVVSAVPRA